MVNAAVLCAAAVKGASREGGGGGTGDALSGNELPEAVKVPEVLRCGCARVGSAQRAIGRLGGGMRTRTGLAGAEEHGKNARRLEPSVGTVVAKAPRGKRDGKKTYG